MSSFSILNQGGPVLDALGTARGSIPFRGANGWTVAAPSTSGWVWTTQGAGADPIWAAPPTGTLPTQTGNANRILTTDGTNASWTLTPSGLTSLGVNTITAAATFDLTLNAATGKNVLFPVGNIGIGTSDFTGLTGVGGLKVASTTASTSTTTGSAVFGGGIGVAGAINAGGNIQTSATVAGDVNFRVTNLSNNAAATATVGLYNDASNALQIFVRSSAGSTPSEGIIQMNAGPLRLTSISTGTIRTASQLISENATSGTSTTAAAILGKSMGLTENLWVGGTGNFASSLTTGAPNGGTAAAWKLGVKTTNTALSAISATDSIELDVGGTLYHIPLVTIVTP